jgi:ribonuclease HI
VYADASWKCNKTPAAAGSTVTGIGVFLQYETNGQSFKVMIQASTTLLPSVLQAEAKALLLAAKLAEWLQIDKPTFLTDNQVLAKAAASRTIDHALLHWDARNILADFFNATRRSRAQVFHIRRDLNFVAHNCAHQVLRQDLSQPIYSCVCSAHANSPCPAISILQNLVCQDFVIHAVLCN